MGNETDGEKRPRDLPVSVLRRRVRGYRDRERNSRPGFRHLTGDQMVNLGPVILVVGEAFIDLCAGDSRKGLRHGVHGLAVLQQPDDVMHADTRAFEARVSASDAGSFSEVTIGFRDGCHAREDTTSKLRLQVPPYFTARLGERGSDAINRFRRSV